LGLIADRLSKTPPIRSRAAHRPGAPVPAGVRVRPPRPEDCDPYTGLNRKSRAFHAGLASPPVDRKSFRRLLDRAQSATYRYWLIERRTDREIVGAIELSQIARGNFRSAYLGYQIGAPFARRGYMREGLATVLNLAFGRLGLHRVEANIQPGNVASIRLVKRLSFRREGLSRKYLKVGGRWRDHERWALLGEDWRASRRRPRER
jgi:[ribosomal protein S5]-alanine N-acetyltransferase